MSDFVIKQNDTRPNLDAQLLNADGAPIDLTDCTVRFLMTPTSSTPPAEDTASFGDYKAEFEVTFPDGSRQTIPNDGYLVISVIKDLG